MNQKQGVKSDTKAYEDVILEVMEKRPKKKASHRELMADPEIEEIEGLSRTLFDRAMKNLVLSGRLNRLEVGNEVSYRLP